MTYATALGIIMLYYAMIVREYIRKYLVIILSWGKYVYNKMTMGLNISTDVFQRELSMIFQNISYILVYIDNILVTCRHSKRY